MTKIVFWQNIVSIHQVDFLREVSKLFEVVLIVHETIDDYRKKEGWNVPETDFLELVVSPNTDEMEQYFQDKSNVHVFSGIGAYATVKKGFDIAVQNNARIGLLSEPRDWTGFKGKIRFIHSYLEKIKYEKHIDFILAIGSKGRWWYTILGYDKKKIFDFGYFIKSPNVDRTSVSTNTERKVIYVGRVITSKGVFDLLEASKIILSNIAKLEIYGSGDEVLDLIKEIKHPKYEGKVIYGGVLTNQQMLMKIQESNLLVLPSKKKDGWGVVVNEALLQGVPVIASVNVGSSYLLATKEFGCVTKNNDINDLARNMKLYLNKKISKVQMIDYYEARITPKVASSYFSTIVHFLYSDKIENKPQAPWLN